MSGLGFFLVAPGVVAALLLLGLVGWYVLMDID